MSNNPIRRQAAFQTRVDAAQLAYDRQHPSHVANEDETKFRGMYPDPCDPKKLMNRPSYLASFTKGLDHDPMTGLIKNPDDFVAFVRGIDSGDPRDFIDTPLGPPLTKDEKPTWLSTKARDASVRAWESAGAGLTFDLEGPDAEAVTMPPAPPVGSDELVAEMAEVYVQALLRDVPFTDIVSGKGMTKDKIKVMDVIKLLNDLPWFKDQDCCGLTDAEASRKRGPFSPQTAFRGITPGDDVGPYISQFMLAGTGGINGGGDNNERKPSEGLVTYGAVSIDQRVRKAKPHVDYMTRWVEWLDVQNGANLGGLEDYVPATNPDSRCFITTPRDLATYVHYDALYEAYLNACLMMLWYGIPFDRGIPFQAPDKIDHQQGFAHFGGPHILSLVTEVATRALKAVRFQKFNVHRRLRPEALAGRLANHSELDVAEIDSMVDQLHPLLQLVKKRNPSDGDLPYGNFLLPMAFCEGSPMHPAYGAGHATVAGACVTILKVFFDHTHPLAIATKGNAGTGDAGMAFVPNAKGELEPKPVVDANGNPATLTVEGELNKLASNISIGRNWAGVHYFTDYIESLRMGEAIAIGILEEQKATYGENFYMTVPLFDGGTIRI